MTQSLIRNLERFGALSDEDKRALESAAFGERELGADQDIAREGERPNACSVILDGFLCRYRVLPNGKRQILNFLIPGDITDLQAVLLEEMDHSIGSLTPCKLTTISHAALREIMEFRPRVARALWQNTLVEAALFRAWIANIGQQEAHGRMAHLLCELMLRLKLVGLADRGEYELPITQTEIGDALGMSAVHVNRTLQELRSRGLITLRGGVLSINDWDRLKEAGQFNPNYLHLRYVPGGEQPSS